MIYNLYLSIFWKCPSSSGTFIKLQFPFYYCFNFLEIWKFHKEIFKKNHILWNIL